MRQLTLATYLKGIIVFTALIITVFMAAVIPSMIISMGDEFPEFKYLVNPCIITIGIGIFPIYAALIAFWNICTQIAKDNSFCKKNSSLLVLIGKCSVIDTVYYFGFTIFLYIVKAFNPGVLLISTFTIVVGLAIAIATFLLSHLVEKASTLQEENNMTI